MVLRDVMNLFNEMLPARMLVFVDGNHLPYRNALHFAAKDIPSMRHGLKYVNRIFRHHSPQFGSGILD